MAWSFKDVAYGWKIGVAAVLTGGITIYTAVNVQNRITQRDAIQVIMGTVERCYATQTATNPTYSVAPPSFVRNWYSNDYVSTVTNGVTNWTAVLYNNVFTNVIGDRLDRAMMVDLDAKIIALCPYYADTNTVYDGTTQIDMLTFTGLLTSLDLGDHTNFTSIPCWTNNVGQTNATTNAATFGPWAWRNYIVAWQERYKVLNALKMTKQNQNAILQYKSVVNWEAGDQGHTTPNTWAAAESNLMASYATMGTSVLTGKLSTYFEISTWKMWSVPEYESDGIGVRAMKVTGFTPLSTSTQLIFETQIFYKCPTNPLIGNYSGSIPAVFEGYGLIGDGGYHLIPSTNFGLANLSVFPEWCNNPTTNDYPLYEFYGTARGVKISEDTELQTWQFNYCTNRWWN